MRKFTDEEEDAYELGADEGYESGFEDGEREGYQQGYDEAIEQLKKARKLISKGLVLRQYSGDYMILSVDGGVAFGKTPEEAQLNFLEQLL